MSVTLPSQAVDAAKTYLLGYPAASRTAGERLFATGAVEFIEPTDVFEYDGIVHDSGDREVTLIFDDKQWRDYCNCSEENRCPHTYAALRALLQQESTGKRVDGSATDQPRAAGKPKPMTFKATIEQRLGRKLKEAEGRIVAAIENIYERSHVATIVTEPALAEFLGRHSFYSVWQTHRLWSTPPRDPWETWLYIAHFLRQRGTPWPAFLTEITSIEEVNALVAEWERKKRIQQWKARLAEMEQEADTESAEEITLRIICEPDAVHLEMREGADRGWVLVKRNQYRELERHATEGTLSFAEEESAAVWSAFTQETPEFGSIDYDDEAALNAIFRNPLIASRVLTSAREPFRRAQERLQWRLEAPESSQGDYRLTLTLPDGTLPPRALCTIEGKPALYIAEDTIYEAPPLSDLSIDERSPNLIPAPALETSGGVALLDQLGITLPPRLTARVTRVRARLVIEAVLVPSPSSRKEEHLHVKFQADWQGAAPSEVYTDSGWKRLRSTDEKTPEEELARKLRERGASAREIREVLQIVKPAAAAEAVKSSPQKQKTKGGIVRLDRGPLRSVPGLISQLSAKWHTLEDVWFRAVTRNFPEVFSDWLQALPSDAQLLLDPELASLRERPVSGSVRLEVESSGVDWFDVSAVLNVEDVELTPEEQQALLNAKGGWVRLGAKGWKRLALKWSEADEERLADLGLSVSDLSGEPQRLHALQLANESAKRLLPAEQAEEVRRRADELRTRVNPPVPATIRAELRPYQVEGFHFLAYLSTNHFGGILADDMGLGKTVQTLTWLAWLREQPGFDGLPSLVACPKSVMPNWRAEAERFLPGLRVNILEKREMESIEEKLRDCDLLVVNYVQLRLLAEKFAAQKWNAVILDEAQAIKNPDSQTAKAACALHAGHRLALSGTPVENRLLDLWSIMAFAMPGALGPRTRFAKLYDKTGDPLARRRLSARVRPFLLRRTKSQVARDLPPRTEEDMICELEGKQETLYRAELKRARQMLLQIKTSKELDKQRMNILTSLLRLRQICCHPALVDAKATKAGSAKLDALLEMLESLMEEGHKVLVFSQFIGALEIIRAALDERGWKHFLLTGSTENRGELVADFQSSEGAAVFLLSLKAGGSGLNLTAASYVVLFDPWWNPAVENQAIDRTHRIGQTQHVMAYRLLVKGSIEEKIRGLQKAKSALAEDILGEEGFARGLTLDDFRFLLGEETE